MRRLFLLLTLLAGCGFQAAQPGQTVTWEPGDFGQGPAKWHHFEWHDLDGKLEGQTLQGDFWWVPMYLEPGDLVWGRVAAWDPVEQRWGSWSEWSNVLVVRWP